MARNHPSRKLLVALLLLLEMIFIAFMMVRADYEERLREKIWPKTAPEISIRTNHLDAPGPMVLLLGDSRMEQWNLPGLRRGRVVNAGAGGMTTGQILLAAPKLLEQLHPDVVVLEAGINDLKFLGLHPEMSQAIVGLAASNLTQTATKVTQRGGRMIVLKTWPTGRPDWARRLAWNAKIPAAVNQLNAKLELLNAPAQGIFVVDIFEEAGLQAELKMFTDTLHFKPEVYQKLTPALENMLDHLPEK